MNPPYRFCGAKICLLYTSAARKVADHIGTVHHEINYIGVEARTVVTS